MCIRDRYTVDPTTGEVSFTPAEGFVGTAAPITVAADVTFNDESGNPVTVPVSNTYTPTVYGIDPVSYTHLDVYKRQVLSCLGLGTIFLCLAQK